jgi:uncharacterized protein YjiK
MGKKKRRREDAPQIELRLIETEQLGVESASAVAALGDGLLLIVDDDRGIFLVGKGEPRLLRGKEDAKALGDLESLCVSVDGQTVYAVSEEKGRVFSFAVERDGPRVSLSEPTLLGVLPRPGGGKNKGWEGASVLPTSRSPKRAASLVLVHERAPMAVGVFSLPDLEPVVLVELHGALEELIDDVADVAVCPTTKNLLLLSDESQRIVEVRLDRDDLEVVGLFDLDLEKGEKPEGISFEAPDRIVIVTDASARLLRFSIAR